MFSMHKNLGPTTRKGRKVGKRKIRPARRKNRHKRRSERKKKEGKDGGIALIIRR